MIIIPRTVCLKRMIGYGRSICDGNDQFFFIDQQIWATLPLDLSI